MYVSVKNIYIYISVFLSWCILSDIWLCFDINRFPRDPYRRKIWLAALGINWEPPKTATVCSHHFTENDFEKWTTNRILKETALPESENIPDEPVKDVNSISQNRLSTYSVPEVSKSLLK